MFTVVLNPIEYGAKKTFNVGSVKTVLIQDLYTSALWMNNQLTTKNKIIEIDHIIKPQILNQVASYGNPNNTQAAKPVDIYATFQTG
ncbi:unnamed protein product [[Candida] boidinii]|nr:unnamed protein product [[Candida] boidinii]